MFAKRLFHKSTSQQDSSGGSKALHEMDLQVAVHYGIPNTASVLAFDPIQRLLAIGTLDGRIKIVGGDNIEGLLICPKKLPYKSLEFLQNKGFLVGVSNENEIQVWNLECRQLTDCLQWEFNITAFSVIHGTYLMYIGDENGLMSVLKYDAEEGKLLRLPYQLTSNAVTEAAGVSFPNPQAIVGILPQPCTLGTRVLIAYEIGLIVLWDVKESRIVNVRGHTELQLKVKENLDSSAEVVGENQDSASENVLHEREICSLCWASDDGSIITVGYINGDIMLWDISVSSSIKEQQVGKSSNDVVKLQLASGDRRLPVIVLHWSSNNKTNNDKGGQLFIYGGDEIGSDEVLTVLSLKWSSGIENSRCISRVDLKLNGSFADMILIPNPGALDNGSTAALFVLTNPGQLDVYDGALLSALKSDEGKLADHFEKFPAVVPSIHPLITVTKFILWPMGNSSKILLEKASAMRMRAIPTLSAGSKWPLAGGVPNELLFSKENGLQRLYIAGYQDGSVRIWDATSPILELLFVFEAKIPGIELDGQSSSVSALDFCSTNMILAVGNESGLVRVYKLLVSNDELIFHVVSDKKHEVHNVRGHGVNCVAAFSILNSPIRSLQFAISGDRFAVGFENGQVAMLDASSMTINSRTECLSGTNSPIISIVTLIIPQSCFVLNSPKHSSPKGVKDHSEEVILILTKDAHIIMIDSTTGSMISLRPMHPKKESVAVAMFVIDEIDASPDVPHDKNYDKISTDASVQSKANENDGSLGSKRQETNCHFSGGASYVVLCCEDALRLYSLKSVIQGDNNAICKVNLSKHCCWATICKRRDEKACGLILLYQSGNLEIRSLPDLEVLAESSLMSILRWSFKANMDRTMSSYDNGQIALVNGCEVAFLSLLSCENDFRIPDSLPCLHDKVVAAAADAAFGHSYQKKRQGPAPGILGGLIKGLKGAKAENNDNVTGNIARSCSAQLEEIFSRVTLPEEETSAISHPEANVLSIDDIEIDDVIPAASTSFPAKKTKKRNEENEREKLLQGASNDTKPRMRTTQEIMTQYRFAGDAAAAAAHARDKLALRQEKLERLSKRTEELQSGAENFAELANELVKTMENKKWWKI